MMSGTSRRLRVLKFRDDKGPGRYVMPPNFVGCSHHSVARYAAAREAGDVTAADAARNTSHPPASPRS
jgi:hypothetical protein